MQFPSIRVGVRVTVNRRLKEVIVGLKQSAVMTQNLGLKVRLLRVVAVVGLGVVAGLSGMMGAIIGVKVGRSLVGRMGSIRVSLTLKMGLSIRRKRGRRLIICPRLERHHG